MKFIAIISLLFSVHAMSATIDLNKSSLEWLGTKITGKHFGSVKFKNASVKMKGDDITGGEFVVDMNTISATDLKGEWKDKLDGHIKNSDFFDVKKFPTAKLVVNKVDKKKIHGNLTIKGKTNPISFEYAKKGKAYKGKMSFDRTKFDIVYGSGNFFKNLGDKTIHDQVTITFNITLK